MTGNLQATYDSFPLQINGFHTVRTGRRARCRTDWRRAADTPTKSRG